jgi:hypothetical protein
MKQRLRIYYTEAQKALMWDRWQKGESMASIARLFDRGHSSVQGIFAETGGIWPETALSGPRGVRALAVSGLDQYSRYQSTIPGGKYHEVRVFIQTDAYRAA